ncbi:thioredoxin domain-containing protein [Echinicola soli]|uniref:Thioredoxin domain-containing protein n=1 Tax=Echinicola soli TaxID=2591634 RepID=A0A514CIW2_9BACT|nr:thioredoxin domain-containing protein [Echinicola soli]QDH79584.1 thioredoxin domain-containing protein [Echinicola soli]
MSQKANQLIYSQSPYLLQHAYNPVQWYPWGPEPLDKAKQENKPIIVSIGYSACHWCHVMEHESFEDEATAAIMNEHFVCIKIDREERPDLDNIYMDAVQSMGLQGGWPLNVFLMPNQKPFYGGTYFPNANWKGLLQNIAEAYEKHFDELAKSAEGFGNSIKLKEREKYRLSDDSSKLTSEDLTHMAQKIASQMDSQWGGFNRSPKFPMPAVWDFVLRYATLKGDAALKDNVLFTLSKMGMGGIYDHLRGGFSRYSVDGEWFAPHFEKMLYDNGQLLSLYAKAFQLTGEALYKEKINETIQWLQTEMHQEEGGFYAALDADSEGEEGKFYTWTYDELESILDDDDAWFYDCYNITVKGNWEKGLNILFQTSPYAEIAQKYGFSMDQLSKKIRQTKERLLKIRNLRTPPGLDDKVISGWNGLTLAGLAQAYWATTNPLAKSLAIKNGAFIAEHMLQGNQLYRSYKGGKAYTPAFLEDYAAVIQGFIHLYPLTGDSHWLHKAKSLTEFVLEHFYDEEDGLFYFNNPDSETLIANKKEIFDNVIPSSNALMANNLHQLGRYYHEDHYLKLAQQLLGLMRTLLLSDPAFLSQWANLYLSEFLGTPEVAIVGRGAKSLALEIQQATPALKVIAVSETKTKDVPLLADKVADQNGNALIYVCFDKTCLRPVATVAEAIDQFPKLN